MLFWTSAVFAATPDELYDFQRSVDNLTLQPELYRQIEEPLVIREGPLTVTLQSGAMVPIFSGRFANEWEKQHEKMLKRLSAKEAEPPAPDQRGSRDVVGFVWLDGEATVELAVEGADAQRLANRLVLEGGLPREAMAEVVAGAPFRTRADRGLVLSADPEVDTWFLGSPDGDPYEIVVWEKPSDLGGARALLQSRLRVWREVGYDWADLVAADRVEAHAGLPNDPVRLVDLQTSDRYRMVSDLPDGSEDRWLAAATVPSGAVDTRWRTRVLAAGRAPEGKGLAGRIAGVPFPPTDPDDATSQRLSPHAVKRVAAKGRVLVQPTDTFLDMEASFRVTVTLEASAPTAFLDVELPRVEA
ncbi:MAG: hypothetical protein KC656_20855, partial [Myxococcales bacterium]|nr:hypothetical protein [Myxococcales bacterium]